MSSTINTSGEGKTGTCLTGKRKWDIHAMINSFLGRCLKVLKCFECVRLVSSITTTPERGCGVSVATKTVAR